MSETEAFKNNLQKVLRRILIPFYPKITDISIHVNEGEIPIRFEIFIYVKVKDNELSYSEDIYSDVKGIFRMLSPEKDYIPIVHFYRAES